ncbi:hypothetical protein H0H87_001528 [Tephrocybe sp. NHM501043]|nr:hypothetical protein H0H87_001528 [Tephrocybe sp. NHM501043]
MVSLPFETIWVEYPNIADVSKTTGFLPTSDGPIPYTLPAIYDPNTSTAIADSVRIAEYLDNAYPDTPKLFPLGSHALQYAFLDALPNKFSPLFQFSLSASNAVLNPPSEEYFRRTRKAIYGKTMEELLPKGEVAVVEWAKVKAGLDEIYGWLEKGKSDGPYLLGRQPGFADIVLASMMIYLKKIWGEDSHLWKDLSNWNNGFWAKLVQDFEKYEVYT